MSINARFLCTDAHANRPSTARSTDCQPIASCCEMATIIGRLAVVGVSMIVRPTSAESSAFGRNQRRLGAEVAPTVTMWLILHPLRETVMTPVSPWFATAKLLHEISLERARTEGYRIVLAEREPRSPEAEIERCRKAAGISRIR